MMIASLDVVKSIYRQYNKELFNNELSSNINIRIGNAKNTSGSVAFIYNQIYKHLTIKNFTISKFHVHTDESLRSVILHEMVHVYLLEKHIIYTTGGNKYHGTEFINKARELEKITGINTIIEDREIKPVANNSSKARYFLLIKKTVGEDSIVSITDKLFYDNYTLVERLESILAYNSNFEKIHIALTRNPEIDKYPKKRTIKTLYKLTPELVDIEANCEIINTITI